MKIGKSLFSNFESFFSSSPLIMSLIEVQEKKKKRTMERKQGMKQCNRQGELGTIQTAYISAKEVKTLKDFLATAMLEHLTMVGLEILPAADLPCWVADQVEPKVDKLEKQMVKVV